TFRDFQATMLLIVPQGLKLLDHAIERKVDQAGKRAGFERAHRIARRLPRPLRRVLFRSVLNEFGGHLHTVGVGSAALDPALAQRWEGVGSEARQGSGITEMGPVVGFTRRARKRLGTRGAALPGPAIRPPAAGGWSVRGP